MRGEDFGATIVVRSWRLSAELVLESGSRRVIIARSVGTGAGTGRFTAAANLVRPGSCCQLPCALLLLPSPEPSKPNAGNSSEGGLDVPVGFPTLWCRFVRESAFVTVVTSTSLGRWCKNSH